jgi:hypothetical protein
VENARKINKQGAPGIKAAPKTTIYQQSDSHR